MSPIGSMKTGSAARPSRTARRWRRPTTARCACRWRRTTRVRTRSPPTRAGGDRRRRTARCPWSPSCESHQGWCECPPFCPGEVGALGTGVRLDADVVGTGVEVGLDPGRRSWPRRPTPTTWSIRRSLPPSAKSSSREPEPAPVVHVVGELEVDAQALACDGSGLAPGRSRARRAAPGASIGPSPSVSRAICVCSGVTR